MKRIIILLTLMITSLIADAQKREVLPFRNKLEGQVVDNALSVRTSFRIPTYVSPTLGGYMDYVGQAFGLATSDTTLNVSLGNGTFATFVNKRWIEDQLANLPSGGGGSANIVAGKAILYDTSTGVVALDTTVAPTFYLADTRYAKVGGNILGANLDLGTIDNRHLAIRTNNVIRFLFGTDGTFTFGANFNSTHPRFAPISGVSSTPTLNGRGLILNTSAGSNFSGFATSLTVDGAAGYTSTNNGHYAVILNGIDWTITSTNSGFGAFVDRATINSSGTATGSSSSFEANPTITAAYDHKQFWARANAQWGFFQDGLNARNLFGGATYLPNLTDGDSEDSILVVSGDSSRIKKIAQSSLSGGGGGTTEDVLIVAVSDEGSELTIGTNKLTFYMPYNVTITDIRASVNVASTTDDVKFDIKEDGVTILNSNLTIVQGANTSTSVTIDDDQIADLAKITIDITSAGIGAAGAKIYFYYERN